MNCGLVVYRKWSWLVQQVVGLLDPVSIPVDNTPEGLSVMCTYYEKVPRRPRTYRYGTRPLETDLYHTTSVICVVHFDYNPHTDTYLLSTEQWTHVRSEFNRLPRERGINIRFVQLFDAMCN